MKEITTGTVILKDELRLPPGVKIETQPCGRRWNAITNTDSYGFDRAIREAGWNFFCLTNTTTISVFGRPTTGRNQRVAGKLGARLLDGEFNAFEITEVSAKTCLGMPYVKMSARSRHVQKSMRLVPDSNVSSRVKIVRNGRDNTGYPVGTAQILPGIRGV